METKQLNVKRKKPNFVRYSYSDHKKLKPNWRRQKGMHNKVRLSKKGHLKSPAIGYGSNKTFKSFYMSQFDYKLINSEKDLESLDKKYVLLSGKLGLKNKLKLVEKLKNLNIKVINLKDLEQFIKEKQNLMKGNKEKKLIEKQTKDDQKKKIQQKIEEKDKKEMTKENKEELEKLEKKKILESPQ
jgi:large subunit ribosomal protein L32e